MNRRSGICERCGKAAWFGRIYCSQACRWEAYAERVEHDFGSTTALTPTGCLEWTGSRSKLGYGRIVIRGVEHYTHRKAWERVNGPIPDGLMVRHKCDNPPCMNVAHLELGTHADNMADMSERGRAKGSGVTGSRVGTARLTEEQVREIRSSTATKSALAAKYGIHRKSIQQIRNGHSWRNVA